MEVKFKLLTNTAEVPKYSRDGDACLDIQSDESVVIKSKSFGLVGTGVACETPNGYEMQVRARSGLAAKKGVGLVNGIGTIDENYRGEIKVILFNLGEEDLIIEKGDRIAQICFHKTIKIEPVSVNELTETNRGDGGFGSSGIKSNKV